LLHHLNVDLLRDSFYALQRKASPGVDGVTDESSYLRLTGGNVRWASQRWKTRSFSKPW